MASSISPESHNTANEIALLVKRTVDTTKDLVEYIEKHPEQVMRLKQELTTAMAVGTLQGLKMKLMKLFF